MSIYDMVDFPDGFGKKFPVSGKDIFSEVKHPWARKIRPDSIVL